MGFDFFGFAMKKLIAMNGEMTMGTREISDLLGNNHSDIKRSADRLVEAGVIGNGQPLAEREFKTGRGNTYTEYLLNKRDSIILVAQNSPEFTARLVDRWQELETKVAELEQKKAARLEQRRAMAVEFRPMTDAIKKAHEDPKPYHYSNECDMINRIVLGMTAAKFRNHHGIDETANPRDYMTDLQAAAIVDLQRANTVLMQFDVGFKERKEKLTELFEKNFKCELIAEVLRIAI